MTNLEKLLSEVATKQIQADDLEKYFDEISICLLQNTKLIAGKSQYSIR